jgi:hypothetical protein
MPGPDLDGIRTHAPLLNIIIDFAPNGLANFLALEAGNAMVIPVVRTSVLFVEKGSKSSLAFSK